MAEKDLKIRITADSGDARDEFKRTGKAVDELGGEADQAAEDLKGAARSINRLGDEAESARRADAPAGVGPHWGRQGGFSS